MNNDLNSTSRVTETDNPQSIGSSAPGFQPSANADTLNQLETKELTVVQTGPPNEAPAPGKAGSPIFTILLAAVVFLAIVRFVYFWARAYVKLRRSNQNMASPVKPVTAQPTIRGRKKLPRSRRHKNSS